MRISFSPLSIPGAFSLSLPCKKDERGESVKSYTQFDFQQQLVGFSPIETLWIHSNKGVLRGIHFQHTQEQSKLIYCIQGEIFGIIVDLRQKEKTFGQWCSVELQTSQECFVPSGCAFGSFALQDAQMLVQYGNNPYISHHNTGIRWDDRDLSIPWPLQSFGGKPILSSLDRSLPSFQDFLSSINK